MSEDDNLPLPVSGEIRDGTHLFPVRVYYEDTDAAGLVYHANYLRFAERARTEFLHLIGWQHERMVRETGMFWVVRWSEIDFIRPAVLGDSLAVATSLIRLGGASLTALQVVRRGRLELVRIKLKLALLNAAGRPGRVPPALGDAITPLLAP